MARAQGGPAADRDARSRAERPVERIDLNRGRRESTANGGLCVVDIHTYHSSNSIYGPTGRNILATDDAAVLIPRHPLVDGTVAARFTQPGSPPVSWRFSVAGPKPA